MNDDICPICDQEMYAFATYYAEHPFIDGRKYPKICHTCFCVPKMYHYNNINEKLIVYESWSPTRLHTPESLMEDAGFPKANCAKSIKAIKKSIKRKTKTSK